MRRFDDARLEALLGDAARTAEWPVTPDLRASVLARVVVPATPDLRPGVEARIERSGAAVGAAARSRSPIGRLLRPLALGIVGLLVIAGAAAGLGFRLPGVEIERVETLPPAGTGLDLGSSITLDEALVSDRPRVLLPSVLPRPGAAYRLGAGDESIITVAWRARPGERTLASSDLALSLMAVPGDTDEGLLSKLAGQGTTIEPVTVGGGRGWWIAGAPHEILIRRPDASIVVLRAAIAGDTLLFARQGTLYRLESALGKDATLGIAASLR
jgi:hypothetical protein